MNPSLIKILIRIFLYLYAYLLFSLAISVLILISYLGLDKKIDWNGVYLMYGILIPIIIIAHILKKKIDKKTLGNIG